MNKLFFVALAATAATGIAAAPAVAGLSHNPSFSHQLPVRVPVGAQPVQVADDHAHHSNDDGRRAATPSPSASPTATQPAVAAVPVEPGDDRGRAVEPGDDKGRAVEPGDDRGAAVEPGDDKGGAVEPGDDKGGAAQPAAGTTAVAEQGDDNGPGKPAAEPGDDSASRGPGGGTKTTGESGSGSSPGPGGGHEGRG